MCPENFIPGLPAERRATFARYIENCIIVCGGRENLWEIDKVEVESSNIFQAHANNNLNI